MAGVATSFALVIMLNGWIEGGTAARSNAVDHIPGFTSMEKCQKASEKIRSSSFKPESTKTVCVESSEPIAIGYALAIMMSGWDDLGSGARGNALDDITGFSTMKQCETAGDKIRDASANKATIKTACVEL